MKTIIIFPNYGPYHIARLEGACAYRPEDEITGLELARHERLYPWETERNGPCKIISLFGGVLEDISVISLCSGVWNYLARENPDAVAISGYTLPAMIVAMIWAKLHGKISILMSESKYDDAKRKPWKEFIKSCVVRGYSAALVGGEPHADYLSLLGFPGDKIFTGCDVVDNNRLKKTADRYREKGNRPIKAEYFIAVNRFVERKNLLRVIEAYKLYRNKTAEPWDLVLIGDGAEAGKLKEAASGIIGIHFTGFLQQDEIIRHMAFAECFIHASYQEQWGLVVNEAMACGLPVIVSQTCGCVPQLVKDGVNGYTFNPWRADELAEKMDFLASGSVKLDGMRRASLNIISGWGPEKFGVNLYQCIKVSG